MMKFKQMEAEQEKKKNLKVISQKWDRSFANGFVLTAVRRKRALGNINYII